MDIKEFINKVCQEIKYEPVKKGISEELTSHIQDIKEEYINKGIQEKEAEEKAVSQMGIAEDIGRNLNKIHKPKLDWKLLILIIALMGFGIFVSVIKQETIDNNNLGNVVIYTLLGIVISIGVYFFDYKKLKKHSLKIYLFAAILMIIPMLIFGPMINGIKYIRLFSITIYPATITVPLYLIAFIGFIIDYDKNNKLNLTILNKDISINKDLAKIIITWLISLILIESVPSFANASILGLSYLIIATIKIIQCKENIVKNLIFLYGVPLLFSALIFIMLLQGSSFRLERVLTSFNPERDPQGSGWVGMLQKDILENAKLIGEADTEALSIENSILGVESNYTFIYIIGKTGFLVAGVLTLIVVLTSIRLIYNAKSIKELYGKYLIIGLGTLYILQSFATILMNINMGLQTNVNLPFVTFGGVFFIVNILSIALILSVYRRKDINEYEEDKESKFVLFKIKESKN